MRQGWGRESGGDAWKQYVRWSAVSLQLRDLVYTVLTTPGDGQLRQDASSRAGSQFRDQLVMS